MNYPGLNELIYLVVGAIMSWLGKHYLPASPLTPKDPAPPAQPPAPPAA